MRKVIQTHKKGLNTDGTFRKKGKKVFISNYPKVQEKTDEFLNLQATNSFELQAQDLVRENYNKIMFDPRYLLKLYNEENLCFDYISEKNLSNKFQELIDAVYDTRRK